MFFIYLFALIATLFAAWRAWRRLRYFLHVFQLEGYKTNEYRHWVSARTGRVVFRLSHKIGFAILVLAYLGFFYWNPFWTALLALPAWAVAFASSKLYRSEQQKKPLKYTSRMKRLLAAAAAVTALPVLAGAIFGLADDGLEGFFWYLLGFYLTDLGVPLWVLLTGMAMKHVEANVQTSFKRQARRTLRSRPNMTIIGITGSYGKTSVKFIIAEILKQRYNVLATPGSYNTPMGICLVVNEKLKPEHQVLVLEMGMRYPGDIRELCEIAQPDIAIVTSVGVAHLETMGSIEAIAEEKGSLLQYMKPGGIAVLNADDARVAAMDQRAPGEVWRVSVSGAPADITARDIRYGAEGATFVVRDDTGAEETFQTKLLGQHNILNVLLGVAVGREMGLRLRQIAHAVRRVQPVEHRLALRKEGAVTIIDDAFNSNPVGARNAVEILGQFNSGRRVIVTPGMVELGERQHEENRTFGEHIAQNVDLAVLVGREQTRPIQEGLLARNFPEDRLKVFNSLFDAQAFLKSYLRPGDTVLYENDLPDQYNEPS
jgi:UDP-N-acetylmuramoyl-tripeptide--D-alanyl-D-alanine ligase